MKRSSGFTLAELLVATGIFLLMGVMLVGMLHSGLEMWDRGEGRRDVYERGQIILDQIARDVAASWVDREPASSKDRSEAFNQNTPPWDRPGMTCDRDPVGRQRLVFTKRGRPDHGGGGEVDLPPPGAPQKAPPKAGGKGPPPSSGGAPANGGQQKPPPSGGGASAGGQGGDDGAGAAGGAGGPGGDAPDWGDDGSAAGGAAVGGGAVGGAGGAAGKVGTGQVVQVVYVMDPEPGQRRLWRGTKVFGGDTLTMKDIEDPKFVHDKLSLLSAGVLSVEYSFWTPDTKDWTGDPGRGGPEDRWDSSRGWDDLFEYHLRDRTKVLSPDILPEKVRVSIVLLPEGDRTRGTTLRGDTDPSAKKIEVDSTRGFPDAPGAALIDDEWFSYTAKDDTTFTVDKRGVKGTRSASHKQGARAVAGETLSTVVYLPCRKPPREDEERR